MDGSCNVGQLVRHHAQPGNAAVNAQFDLATLNAVCDGLRHAGNCLEDIGLCVGNALSDAQTDVFTDFIPGTPGRENGCPTSAWRR